MGVNDAFASGGSPARHGALVALSAALLFGVSTPLVQAEQALFFGETPVNKMACAVMERLQPHSCAQYHADALGTYFNSIKFWKTPIATCDDGSKNCVDYSQWQSAWTTVTAG